MVNSVANEPHLHLRYRRRNRGRRAAGAGGGYHDGNGPNNMNANDVDAEQATTTFGNFPVVSLTAQQDYYVKYNLECFLLYAIERAKKENGLCLRNMFEVIQILEKNPKYAVACDPTQTPRDDHHQLVHLAWLNKVEDDEGAEQLFFEETLTQKRSSSSPEDTEASEAKKRVFMERVSILTDRNRFCLVCFEFFGLSYFEYCYNQEERITNEFFGNKDALGFLDDNGCKMRSEFLRYLIAARGPEKMLAFTDVYEMILNIVGRLKRRVFEEELALDSDIALEVFGLK